MEIQKESYQGHNHHKIIQIIQTGQHGQNGLPVAVVVEGPISQNQARGVEMVSGKTLFSGRSFKHQIIRLVTLCIPENPVAPIFNMGGSHDQMFI